MARHLALIHGPSLPLIDVTAKAVLLYVETVTQSNIKYLKEAIEMFTTVLNEATNMTEKDETQMSSLKLQIDPLLGSFNEILSNEVKNGGHFETASEDGELLRSLQCVLDCCLQVAKIDDWAALVAAHLANPAQICTRLKAIGDENGQICTGMSDLTVN